MGDVALRLLASAAQPELRHLRRSEEELDSAIYWREVLLTATEPVSIGSLFPTS
jgi:hypothetical protein